MEVPTDDIRFQIELEFIQCLASPSYLNRTVLHASWTALTTYPHALTFLDLLDDEKFRQ
ncbi:hypothetical protein B5M09_005850, partial [Aphanomyces astaci]